MVERHPLLEAARLVERDAFAIAAELRQAVLDNDMRHVEVALDRLMNIANAMRAAVPCQDDPIRMLGDVLRKSGRVRHGV